MFVLLRHFLKSCTGVGRVMMMHCWICNECMQFMNSLFVPSPLLLSLFSWTVNLCYSFYHNRLKRVDAGFDLSTFGGTKEDRHSIESFLCCLGTSLSDRNENHAHPNNWMNIGVLQFFSTTSAFHCILVSLIAR